MLCTTVSKATVWLRMWDFLVVTTRRCYGHLISHPMATGDIFRRGWLKSTGTEQVRSRGNASDLYSENARFETRPGHRLTVRGLMVLFSPSKCLNSTSIRPQEIPSKPSPMHYQTSYHSTLNRLRYSIVNPP